MKYCLFLLMLISPAIAAAEEARAIAVNPSIETQVQRLSQELRCLVCQNQTLADSTAPLAEDLREEIREMAAKGMNDEQITDYLVARYGDFVRYRPPLKSTTILLWLGPFLLLVIGVVGLIAFLRQRQRQLAEVPLSKEDLSKVNKLLKAE